jgi:hypothetical protein
MPATAVAAIDEPSIEHEGRAGNHFDSSWCLSPAAADPRRADLPPDLDNPDRVDEYLRFRPRRYADLFVRVPDP